MAMPTRREVLGIAAIFVAGTFVGAEEEGYALLDKTYRFTAEVTIRDLPVPRVLRPIVPETIKTFARGTIGRETMIDLPMPGIIPNYHIEGGIKNERLILRIERGALENRLMLATIETEGTIGELGIYRANKEWKRGKMTATGTGRIASDAPLIVFRSLDPEPDFDTYALMITFGEQRIQGRFEGRKEKAEECARLLLSFEGECREA